MKLSIQHVCAIIVTYHPDDAFGTRLEAISYQVGATIIVDNGSNNLAMLQKLSVANHAVLIENKQNVGIATALNIGVNHAVERNFKWVLLFDQDTIAHNNLCQSLCDIYSVYSLKEKIGLIGSDYINPIMQTKKPKIDQPYTEVSRLITSGTLLSTDAYQTIGRFNDDYFIDMVDLEYCVRAKRLGFALLKSTEHLMTHSVGFPSKHTFFGKTIWLNNHNPLRRYYYARNYVAFQKTHGGYHFGWWAIKSLKKCIKLILLICLFENNKLAKTKAIIIGWFDGVNNRMGEKKSL